MPFLSMVLDWLCNNPHEDLTDFEFSQMILEQINSREPSIKSTKFKIYYYMELIESSPDFILSFAEEINSSDMWKFSGFLIDRIIELSEIKEHIERVESNNYRVDVLENDQCNEYLFKIEESLYVNEANSNFAILLNDRIFSLFLNTEAEVSKFPDLIKFYNRYAKLVKDSTELQNISIIIAMARIRSILEWYSKEIIEESEKIAETEDSFNQIS